MNKQLVKENNGRLGVYSFYDTKSKTYDTPFFCESDLFSIRHYKIVTNKDGTMLSVFKKEFDLVKIGEYDQKTGVIHNFNETIIKGVDNEISNES